MEGFKGYLHAREVHKINNDVDYGGNINCIGEILLSKFFLSVGVGQLCLEILCESMLRRSINRKI